MERESPRWNARCDLIRPLNNYDDLLRVVSAYYEMYEKGARYLAPYMSRQNSSQFPFLPPDKDQVKEGVGKVRNVIHPVIYNSYLNELINFATKWKGKRALIQPHQTTHHSAQFSEGTFHIKKVGSKHEITVFGVDEPFYVDRLQLTPEQVKFIIIRPKLGKLGTASVLKWEVLFFKNNFNYLIDHVDSDLNPTYAGRL